MELENIEDFEIGTYRALVEYGQTPCIQSIWTRTTIGNKVWLVERDENGVIKSKFMEVGDRWVEVRNDTTIN
jgi:hypothetical protein